MRRAITVVALSGSLLVGALLASACAASEPATPSATPTPGPAERLQGVRTLETYRYTLNLRAAGSILDQSEAPEGLNLDEAVLAVDIEGRWVQPDREYQSAQIRFAILEARHDSIAIGERLWTSVEGGPWREREALTGPEEFLGQDLPLSPDAIFGNADDEMLTRLTADLEARPHHLQIVNGRNARHWELGQDWFDEFATDFADILAGVGRDQGMDLHIELWSDIETGVGVKLLVLGTFPGETEPAIDLRMELFDINSPDVTVDEPPGAIGR